MKQISLCLGFLLLTFLMACGNEGVRKDEKPIDIHDLAKNQPLNNDWVSVGKSTYELKCMSCHRLSEVKLVGPGWKGVTQRRKPLWIINMITNVDMMLEKDPEAQKMLEQCLVRMPNQNITPDEARKVIEFMRSNDGEK